MQYGLYYNYRKGDYLRIVFNNVNNHDNTEKFDNVEVFYSGNKVDEIRILDFSNIMKIKVEGLLPVINSKVLEIINSTLINHGLSPLETQKNSGFEVGKIINIEKVDDCSICNVDLGNKVVKIVSKSKNLYQGLRCVVCLNGTFMPDGNQLKQVEYKGYLSDGLICSANDLDVTKDSKSDDAIELGDGFELGSDFFQLM